MTPLFSIVTPTMNRSDYLPDMINGILEQKVQDWELIVVDDGGNDSTPELMEFYTIADERIKYFRKRHSGIAKTRNYGNSRARGKWIIVSDSDDIWEHNRLELLQKYIKKHPKIDFIYGGMLWASHSGEMVKEYWRPSELTAEKLRSGNQGVIHGACAYKKWVAEEVPYRPEQKINDDYWFIVDCWNKGVEFGFINAPLMRYRILPDGVSRVNYDKIQAEIKRKLKKEVIYDRRCKRIQNE